jgi:CubicO group peptidase (beta-lactamase class C family)
MKHLLLLLSIVFTANLGFTQKALPEDVTKSIQSRIEYGISPSIVVGIIDKNGPKYYAFGTKTLGGKPVNENTIYEIGSISKTFTGILLAQMVINGQMKTDDAAQKYLPAAVKLPKWENTEITLGNLSDHTSSLPRLPTNMVPADPANPYADYTVDQLYAFLNGYTLTRPIGSVYEYSNLAQGLLGNILALKTGKSYEQLMIANIAAPLGMKVTKITFDEAMKQNLAMGYSQGTQVANWDIPTLAGAGAIRSSLHDMLIFIAANLGLKRSKFYPAMQLSHQARHDKPGGGTRVGLAWHISKGAEGDVIWHNGGTGGYRTFAGFVKETGKGVVVLTNSTAGADDIGMRLLNSSAKLIQVKKPALLDIKKIADSQGADAAWKAYEDIKKNPASSYDFNEDQFNETGYAYLEAKNTKLAAVIFKINVAEHPKSANAYDSYAEALMKDGQQTAAIENYQKSLELNPNNTNAVDMLAKMGIGKPSTTFKVDEAILESYVGSYQLTPGFKITIMKEGARLFGIPTGQGKFELFAKSETEFFLKVVEAKVIFTVKNGKAESLTLYQGGQALLGKRVD